MTAKASETHPGELHAEIGAGSHRILIFMEIVMVKLHTEGWGLVTAQEGIGAAINPEGGGYAIEQDFGY